MLAAATTLAAAAAEEVEHLPIPPFAYGLVAFSILMAGLFVTFAFRSVGSRH